MNKRKILNILFWVLLLIVIALILWRIFGNSPTDLQIIIPIMLMFLVKMWTISDEVKELKHEVRMSFSKVKSELEKIKK